MDVFLEKLFVILKLAFEVEEIPDHDITLLFDEPI